MNLLDKIKSLVLTGSDRTVKAKKNVLMTIVIKVLGVLIGFAYFPLSLEYLGPVKFGIFLTLLSVIDWFLNFDIGIGLGLRNKFGESIANGDEKKAVSYVSTAYFILSIIIVILTIILLVLNFTIPWTRWLTIDQNLNEEVTSLNAIIILAFGIRFIAQNVYEIFYALQKMAYVELFSFLTKLSFLILILVIPYIQKDSLLLFGGAKALTFALVPLIVGIYYFRTKFKKYRPSFKHVELSYFKDLFSLGLKFFLIKISMLIIHHTNNMLIATFVSLDGVPKYEAAFKYLSIFIMLFTILNNQLWPSNIEAYNKGDFAWMKKSMHKVTKVWLLTLLLIILMILISPFVYEFWLQGRLEIPLVITITVAISVSLSNWVNMYNIVLNGTGKITMQMYAWLFAALINIPMSIFFVKVLDFGVAGIVLGTIVSLIPLAIISPIQVHKILSKSERGVWSK
jgi:O-antigen/teichoic acid export membrane protein